MKHVLSIFIFLTLSTFCRAQDTVTKNGKTYIFIGHMPEFRGDYMQFIRNHIQYPFDARTANISGQVMVRFIINEDGTVSDPIIIRHVYPSLDSEAVRVVKLMLWKPGATANGKRIKVPQSLPVNFQLNDVSANPH
ncbi:MAG: energy transducer TonB [Taibaiella sp.]|nr:energy transducer TonB [Taibaiella sp.]